MKLISTIQAVIAALNLGAAYAHLLEMAPKRAMSGRDWITTQHTYRDFGKVAGTLMPLSVVLALARTVQARKAPGRASLFGIHAACTLATVGIWAKANQPVNREIVHWDPANLPSNWKQRRDQWEFGHATSAVLHLLGFIALITALLRRD